MCMLSNKFQNKKSKYVEHKFKAFVQSEKFKLSYRKSMFLVWNFKGLSLEDRARQVSEHSANIGRFRQSYMQPRLHTVGILRKDTPLRSGFGV
jgi:hypothetical protein